MNDQRKHKLKSIILVLVLSLALSIIVLDTTLLNVSLSAIIKDLDTNLQNIQWVITAYALTLTSLTILGGRLGDIFGRRKMFITGAIIFAVGSFITSISQNITTMIIGESIIEGIGAALMMPATMSILISRFQGRSRALALGIWGGVAGASAALGPIVGGYLTTHYSWRWGFRINIFVAIILVTSAIFVIGNNKNDRRKMKLDWTGIVLSTLGLLFFVFAIIEASTFGWFFETRVAHLGTSAISMPFGLSFVPVCMLIGIILLTIFAYWENKLEKHDTKIPLVSLQIFKNKPFSSGVGVMAIVALGQSGIIFALPVFFQSVRGFTALETGLSLMPMSIMLLFIAPLGGYLSGRVRPRLLIQIGMIVQFLGLIVLRSTFSVDATSSDFIIPLMLIGLGMGLVFSQITNLAMIDIKNEEAGEASGINSTMRQLGATLGSALIGSILLTVLASNITSGIMNSDKIPEQYKAQVISAAKAQSSGVEFGGIKNDGSNIPVQVKKEIVEVTHQATVTGNKAALATSAIVALFGFFISFILPNIDKITHKKPEEIAIGSDVPFYAIET